MSQISQSVLQFASSRMGTRVGQGECFDLADQALRGAGAKSAADYGEVTANADYVWGTSVELAQVEAGDVIQFRDYRMRVTIRTTWPDGSDEEEFSEQTRPHHTAIVASVDGGGRLTMYEQNVGSGSSQRTVQRNNLYLSSSSTVRTERRGNETVTVRTVVEVSGTRRYYRPQPQ